MKELTEKEVLLKLTAVCAKREYCLADMTEKMRRWQIDSATQERVKQYLVTHKYIDEARYAKAFINDKVRYNKWGLKKVAHALYIKGIDESVFTPLLANVNTNAYLKELHKIIEAKKKTLKEPDPYKRKNKLIRFALGKGYAMNEVMEAIRQSQETNDFTKNKTSYKEIKNDS